MCVYIYMHSHKYMYCINMCLIFKYLCRTMVPGFSASNELPNNIEEALLWWLNKVCTVLQQRLSTLFPNHVRQLVLSLLFYSSYKKC